jgi:hypothetical protein
MSVIDHLKKEIAVRHNTQLQNDDPILMNVTTQDVLIEYTVKRLEAMLAEAQNKITASTQETLQSAEQIASKMINNSAKHLESRFQEAAGIIAGQVQEAVQEKMAQDLRVQKITVMAALVTVAVSAFTLGMWFSIFLPHQ